MTAPAHPDALSEILGFIAAYWWLLLLFGGTILEFFGDVFSGAARAIGEWSRTRHERRLELRRMELETAGRHAAEDAGPVPGLCRHRRAVPVRDLDGAVVAWLCKGCDEQLPPDFSIFSEDL